MYIEQKPYHSFCLISGAEGQFLNCEWVFTLDCETYVSVAECGTDGVTYENRY